MTSAHSLSTVQHSTAAVLTISSSSRGLSAPGLDNNNTTATGNMEVVYNFDDSALYFQDVLKAFQMYPHFSAFPYVLHDYFEKYSQEILLPLHNA